VESARGIVQVRFKGLGMRWSRAVVQDMITLREAEANDR
jgi:hypothetical protein